MESLIEQASESIRQSRLQSAAADLIELLRPAISLSASPVAMRDLAMGDSRIGGIPDLPAGSEWPVGQGAPLPFYAQIRCADLVAYDPQALLPQTGWLYFFYDVLSERSQLDRSDFWRVLYVPDETVELQRTPTPATLDEWEQYGACAVSLASSVMLPCFGVPLLDGCGLSYSHYTGVAEEQRYQKLLDQLSELSDAEDEKSRQAVHLLGYPDEFGPVQGADWQLLLQIDTNKAALQGASRMEKGDWLAIYFWISREALARRDFQQVEVLVDGD